MNLSVAMDIAFHSTWYVMMSMTVVTILMRRDAVSKYLFLYFIVVTQVNLLEACNNIK